MKKHIILILSVVAVFGFSGCGSSGNDYDDGLTTLFLVDDQDFAYANIPYRCDSMNYWSTTRPNGEFSFYPGEDCEFDFLGLDGVYGDVFDDVVRIVDYRYSGKGGIPYECASFGASSTYFDGSFDYDIDDQCVFYL